jgi:geranylgeranyl diphosphate synthase type II
MPRPETVSSQLDALRDTVERGLAALQLPSEPAALYEPMRYVLSGGGKRFRPVLLLLAAEAYGGDDAARRALPAALGIEVFHNFTLVHDDIMDNAASRRGRASVHVAWSESTAILSGDMMMGLSYELLAQAEGVDLAEAMRVYAAMVHRLCQGQALDDGFAARGDVTLGEYLHMIDGKTAALLECALEIGSLIGGAGEGQRARLVEAGNALGRAFQIQDDLLDLVAEDARWGKTVGGDLIEGKRTWLLLSALERAEGSQREWFEQILARPGLALEHIGEARERMARLGVLEAASESVAEYSARAARAFGAMPESSARAALIDLAERLQRRVH